MLVIDAMCPDDRDKFASGIQRSVMRLLMGHELEPPAHPSRHLGVVFELCVQVGYGVGAFREPLNVSFSSQQDCILTSSGEF